jgi:hypothetical protein
MDMLKRVFIILIFFFCKLSYGQTDKDTLLVYVGLDMTYKNAVITDTTTNISLKFSRRDSKYLLPKILITEKNTVTLKVYARSRFFGRKKHCGFITIKDFKTNKIYFSIEDKKFKYEFVNRVRKIM